MKKHSKCCVITGAAGGVGNALVQIFHDAGYCVIATDRVTDPGELSFSHYVQADLGRMVDEDEYAELVLNKIRCLLENKPLKVLVNNAAIQILGGADTLTRMDWRHTLNVNLLAPFFLTQALLSELEAANGCVVNIGSIHARLTKKNFVAYATSKAALAGMTRALAVDLGPRVRINTIEPAAIETKMLKAGFEGNSSLYTQLEQCHPQQQIGHPEDLARLAFSIVEGDIKFLHGACIGLDGGISGRLHDPG